MAAVGENPAGKREDAGGEVEAAGKTGFSHQKLYLVPRLRGIKQIVIALNLSRIWVVFCKFETGLLTDCLL